MQNVGIRYPLYFAIPALLLYGMFYIVPSLGGIAYAFTDWSSYSDEVNFVGLKNFIKLFSPGEHYLGYFWNTFLFTLVTIILKTIFGLGLALLLNEGVKRFVNVYRVLIYIPAVLPFIVVGLIFRSILNPATGLLNTFLRAIGLNAVAMQWLVDPRIALYSVIFVDTWKGVGYIMVILLAGLQTIPRDYYEAAEMDGANAWWQFRYVTVPLLMPAIMIVTVLNVLYGIRVFDIVYAMTNGGPGYATEVLQTGIFKAFSQGQYGLGTALNSVLFVILIAAGYGVIRLLDPKPVGE
ncbi:sugar ABC transporter permease [Devosia sp.]|uniref:carbohydrate ABC transporter permease n=1 Tax=Devosia sp. TaxID=1871048 RepID=UPI0032658E0A